MKKVKLRKGKVNGRDGRRTAWVNRQRRDHDALNHFDSEYTQDRLRALDFYLGEPLGNEVEVDLLSSPPSLPTRLRRSRRT